MLDLQTLLLNKSLLWHHRMLYPEPILDLDRLQASNSTFSTMPSSYRQNSVDPWGTATATGRYQFTSSNPSTIPGTGHSAPGMINGLHSVLSGTGLPPWVVEATGKCSGDDFRSTGVHFKPVYCVWDCHWGELGGSWFGNKEASVLMGYFFD